MPIRPLRPERQTGLAPTTSKSIADASRPFFSQIQMSRWRSMTIIVVLMAAMVAVPFAGAAVGATAEIALSDDGEPPQGSTPVMILIGNLSVGSLGLVTFLLMRYVGKAPIRACLSVGRSFSWRLLVRFTAVLALPMLSAAIVLEALAGSAGIPATISQTTILTLVIVLLTAPLQAAGEEIVFRSGIGPAVGSWFRAPRTAMVFGLLASSVLFGLVHLPMDPDPWLAFYYPWLGLVLGLSAVISRGIEAPIALHAVNNLVTLGLGVLLSDGYALEVDRSASAVSTGMLTVTVLVPTHIVLLIALTLVSRRRDRRSRASGPR